MSEFKEYRDAMKIYRHSVNFARQNYAVPLIPVILKALAPFAMPALSAIKIIGSIFLALTFCKDIWEVLTKKLPNFLSRLWEYRQKSKDYIKEQEELDKKRESCTQFQKDAIGFLKEIAIPLGELLKNLQEQEEGKAYDSVEKQKKIEQYKVFSQLLDFIDSDEFEEILQGRREITQEMLQKEQEIVNQFIKAYEPPPSERSALAEMALALGMPAAYMAGGPQEIEKLASKVIATRAGVAAGSAADVGLNALTKTLGGVTKLNSLFFSVPAFVGYLALMGLDWVGNSTLDKNVRELAAIMANGKSMMEALNQQEAVFRQQFKAYKEQVAADIAEAKDVIMKSDADPAHKQTVLAQLDKLDVSMSKYNFSVVTEAAASIAKTGINLLKNKTFDTAMLGVIAGMAIEKYKNKKEEELANRLLTEEANKMKKFRFVN